MTYISHSSKFLHSYHARHAFFTYISPSLRLLTYIWRSSRLCYVRITLVAPFLRTYYACHDFKRKIKLVKDFYTRIALITPFLRTYHSRDAVFTYISRSSCLLTYISRLAPFLTYKTRSSIFLHTYRAHHAFNTYTSRLSRLLAYEPRSSRLFYVHMTLVTPFNVRITLITNFFVHITLGTPFLRTYHAYHAF